MNKPDSIYHPDEYRKTAEAARCAAAHTRKLAAAFGATGRALAGLRKALTPRGYGDAE